jgi:hypothetical protein
MERSTIGKRDHEEKSSWIEQSKVTHRVDQRRKKRKRS